MVNHILEFPRLVILTVLTRTLQKCNVTRNKENIEILTSLGTPCIHVKNTKVLVLATQSSDCHIITELTTFPSWTLYKL